MTAAMVSTPAAASLRSRRVPCGCQKRQLDVKTSAARNAMPMYTNSEARLEISVPACVRRSGSDGTYTTAVSASVARSGVR